MKIVEIYLNEERTGVGCGWRDAVVTKVGRVYTTAVLVDSLLPIELPHERFETLSRPSKARPNRVRAILREQKKRFERYGWTTGRRNGKLRLRSANEALRAL